MNTYFIFGLLFISNLVLLVTTNVNVFAEFFFYSWLMRNGQLMYRDFFINHGFLLYTLLIPASSDKTLIITKAICIIVQCLNFGFILVILKKISTSLGVFFGGVVYICLNFYFSQNNMWDELFITTILLALYMVITHRNVSFRQYFIGLLLVLLSFIKPTNALYAIPVLIIVRSVRFLIVPIIGWILAGLFFYVHQGLPAFIDSVLLFNRFYGAYIWTHNTYSLDQRILLFSSGVSIVPIGLFLFEKRARVVGLPLIIFFVFTIPLSFFPCCTESHLAPFVAFFSLLIGYGVAYVKRPLAIVFLCVLSVYAGYLIYRTIGQYQVLNSKRVVYFADDLHIKRIREIGSIIPKTATMYVWGNQVEVYYLLDRASPTYFPIVFPVVSSYYTHLEQRIISDIESKNVEYVVRLKPYDAHYEMLKVLQEYIQCRFERVYDSAGYEIYRVTTANKQCTIDNSL